MIALEIRDGSVQRIEIARPARRAGFARIRLLTAGICNTDLELARGYYGFSGIPGHEFVGEVIESDTESLVGQRVVGEINLDCGHCDWCARGLGRHCPDRTVLGIVKHPGAFAEELVLPDRNLHIVPDHVSTDDAVFTEPVAAACEILEQVQIPKGAEVALLGDGKLGLLIAQVLLGHSVAVHHFGRHEAKLAISQAAGAITTTRRPERTYDYVVDATGSAKGLELAISITRPRGTLIMKSTVHERVPLDTAPIIVNEITMVGSRCGRFGPALQLIADGRLHLAPLVAAKYKLADGVAAFAAAAQTGTLKVLVENAS